jgi:hypothetical protein
MTRWCLAWAEAILCSSHIWTWWQIVGWYSVFRHAPAIVGVVAVVRRGRGAERALRGHFQLIRVFNVSLEVHFLLCQHFEPFQPSALSRLSSRGSVRKLDGWKYRDILARPHLARPRTLVSARCSTRRSHPFPHCRTNYCVHSTFTLKICRFSAICTMSAK